jgi:hypothetical protein
MSNAAFAHLMQQLSFTYVDCGQTPHIYFQHFHQAPLDALHLVSLVMGM